MKNKHLATLKDSVHIACDFVGINERYFRKLATPEGFFIEHDTPGLSPQEIAVAALSYFCDGTDAVVKKVACHAIVDFLDTTLGVDDTDTSRVLRMRDLLGTVDAGGSDDQYRRWAKGWYP